MDSQTKVYRLYGKAVQRYGVYIEKSHKGIASIWKESHKGIDNVYMEKS